MNRFVFKIKMPPDVRVLLINDLADIEYVSMSHTFFICFTILYLSGCGQYVWPIIVIVFQIVKFERYDMLLI